MSVAASGDMVTDVGIGTKETKDVATGTRRGILTRSVLCGALFAIPVGSGVLLSPLFRKSLKQIVNPQEIMGHAAALASVSTALTYWKTERPGTHGWLPYIDTRAALLCSFAATAACHMWYPGVFIVVMERGPIMFRVREYTRLTAKCSGAYFLAPHFVGVASFGLLIAGVSRLAGRR